ncbi:MAG: low temperature requirement protein A [Actinomycetia bacterium]|nr:low temperature requirement protein A [Actinomycetes bacterium]
MTTTEPTEVVERHANNLELFLDLVFVFAITQVASFISHNPGGVGVAKGALIAFLVWWQWSQFTWAGSAIDLQQVATTRVLVLCLMPVTLLMTIAIPEAFHHDAVWFGAAYLGVQLVVLGITGSQALRSAATRAGFIGYASVVSIAPVLVFIGAFLHDGWRISAWVIAAVLNIVGGFTATRGEWAINSVHFAERHSLFIIISLGEVLVAAGASATDVGLARGTAFAIVVSVGLACVLWWTYFAYIPEVVERTLRDATASQRGVLARDVFTFGHFPLAFGLVLYAGVVKHIVAHPFGHLALNDRWLLASAVAAFVGGLFMLRVRIAKQFAWDRVLVVVAVAALCVLGGQLPALVVVGGVALLIGLSQSLSLKRYRAANSANPS